MPKVKYTSLKNQYELNKNNDVFSLYDESGKKINAHNSTKIQYLNDMMNAGYDVSKFQSIMQQQVLPIAEKVRENTELRNAFKEMELKPQTVEELFKDSDPEESLEAPKGLAHEYQSVVSTTGSELTETKEKLKEIEEIESKGGRVDDAVQKELNDRIVFLELSLKKTNDELDYLKSQTAVGTLIVEKEEGDAKVAPVQAPQAVNNVPVSNVPVDAMGFPFLIPDDAIAITPSEPLVSLDIATALSTAPISPIANVDEKLETGINAIDLENLESSRIEQNVALRVNALVPKYHLNQMKEMYDWREGLNINWDTALTESILDLGLDKPTIALYIDGLIKEYSNKFLIYSKKSDDDLLEYIELRNLQYSFERGMHIGKRTKQALINISDLAKITGSPMPTDNNYNNMNLTPSDQVETALAATTNAKASQSIAVPSTTVILTPVQSVELTRNPFLRQYGVDMSTQRYKIQMDPENY